MIHITRYGDKVRLMNQTGGRNLTMTAEEARNLESDILTILAAMADLINAEPKQKEEITATLDGGKF